MKITDLNGKIIHITDLTKALAQADNFRKYKHIGNEKISFDKERKKYWQDIYKKLKIKEHERKNLNNNSL